MKEASSVAAMNPGGYTELVKIPRGSRGTTTVKDAGEAVGPVLEIGGIDNVERALNRACGTETTKLEAALGFLGDHRKRQPLYWPLRNHVGDHGHLQGDRRPWFGDTGRRRTGDLGSAYPEG